MKKLSGWQLGVLLLVVGVATTALAISYTGDIGINDEYLVGTDGWSDAELSWIVDDTAGYWTYAYTFEVFEHGGQVKGLSHIIFELSPDLDYVIDWAAGPGPTESEIGSYSSGSSNPGMPWAGNGIKFQEFDDEDALGDAYTAWTMTIVSDRAPMWGDFYAKGGQHEGVDVIAYNLLHGETTTAAIGDGNADGFVLVPDTVSIPDAATIFLLGTACIIGFVPLRRKEKA